MSYHRTAKAIGAASFSVLALAMAALAPANAQEKTLRIVMREDIKAIDPIWLGGNSDITRIYAYQIFDTLFGFDSKGNIKPQMVDTYEVSSDQLTYTMRLRAGLKFHDGTPVTADDVKSSIERWMGSDASAPIFAKYLDTITAVDTNTVRIQLKRPYGLLLETLAKFGNRPVFIMPKRLASTPADKQLTEIVGSGPFRFEKSEWRPGYKIVDVRHKDYVPRQEPADAFAGGKIPGVDRLEFITLPDPQSAVNALMAGEIDFIEKPPIDLLPILRQNPNIVVESLEKAGNVGVLRVNWLHPPFNDVRARRGLMWIMNQEDILRSIVGGDMSLARVCGSAMVCGMPYASETGAEPLLSKEPASVRYEKARALFKEAGYKNEPIILLDQGDERMVHSAMTVLAAQMREAGLNVVVDTMDSGAIGKRQNSKAPPGQGGWHLAMIVGGIGNQFPLFSRNASAACDQAWFGWPCDPKIEEIREGWTNASTPEQNTKLAEQLQVRTMEVVPWIPFGQWIDPIAYRKDIAGFVPARLTQTFWNVTKK